MLFSRSTVYSALFLVMNFTTVAFLYFTLGAPFIALAQITVYAGAIMVLFLFVIMLMGTETEKVEQNKSVGPGAWSPGNPDSAGRSGCSDLCQESI